MQQAAGLIGAICGWVSMLASLYAAWLWYQASRAKVFFEVGAFAPVHKADLAVKITQPNVIDATAIADLSNKLNAQAAMWTALAIAAQAISQALILL